LQWNRAIAASEPRTGWWFVWESTLTSRAIQQQPAHLRTSLPWTPRTRESP
jgi:hypothetical protein